MFVYDRVTLFCKAGKERPTESKGLREAFTMKKNCTAKVRFLLTKNKLVVREVNLHHENHRSDKQTFDHYIENLRLDANKQKEPEKFISLDVNKQRLKMYLMRDGSKVPLKALHNIQTKQRNEYKSSSGESQLQDLLE